MKTKHTYWWQNKKLLQERRRQAERHARLLDARIRKLRLESAQHEHLAVLRELARMADRSTNQTRKVVLRSVIRELARKWRVVKLWEKERE